MFSAVNRFLSACSQTYIYIVGILLIATIGTIDYVTGREISVAFFYLLPILLVTWYGRRGAGYTASVISAVIWLMADKSTSHIYSHYLIPYWNAMARLGFFITTTYLLASLKGHFLREQSLARVDELTQLYSARTFKELAANLISLSQRHGHPMALAYLDLDDFKQVNDNFGHSEGDAVLRMVGATLKRCVRSSDIIGRLGGDEFAIAMPETGLNAARVAFKKIHQELNLQNDQTQWPVGFSIGVAVFTTAPSGLEDAINFADRLMYCVKASGKNQVVVEEYKPPSININPRILQGQPEVHD